MDLLHYEIGAMSKGKIHCKSCQVLHQEMFFADKDNDFFTATAGSAASLTELFGSG